MLNRRKQSQECEDNIIDSERGSSVTSNGHSAHADYTQSPSSHSQPQFNYDPPANNTYGHGLVRFKSKEESQIAYPLPVQRKQMEKSQDFSPTGTGYATDFRIRETSNIPAQSYYNQSFSMEPISHSRAIDISNSYSKQRSNTDFVYYSIQSGDTLQNLSVKYSCPIASIKRLNNLWSDQDFHGLSRIKLPTGRLRLLADVLDEQGATTSRPDRNLDPKQEATNSFTTPSTSDIHSKILTNETMSTQFQNYQKSRLETLNKNLTDQDYDRDSMTSSDSIFKDLDLNIEKARTAARSYDNNVNAILQSLADSGNIVVDDDNISSPTNIARREAETLLNDMTDFGMTYSGLILFIFIVCLICPLAYVIYLEETHHDYSKTPQLETTHIGSI